MTDGHEVSPAKSRDLQLFDALMRRAPGQPVSQRRLAAELGIALGLTNLMLRRMAIKGWLRIRRIRPNRVSYLITPAGITEKARMSRDYFVRTVERYAEARQRIADGFNTLCAQTPPGGERRRIVFLGAGDVAEIGYICVQDRELELVGVIDDRRQRPFFGVSVYRMADLTGATLSGQAYWKLIVMSLDDPRETAAALDRRGVPSERIYWL